MPDPETITATGTAVAAVITALSPILIVAFRSRRAKKIRIPKKQINP